VEPFIPAHEPAFHAGGFYMQEASSMFLHHVLGEIDGPEQARILDLAAAPGGKSTLIRSAWPNALLVANEVVRSRVAILAENLSRWGAKNAVVTNSDPQDFKHLEHYFDLILVDAPCSGEGLFCRDPAAVDQWSERNATHSAVRQKRILSDGEAALKPGGYLVYSTCTYNPAENEDQIKWFADEFGFSGVEIPIDVGWNIEQGETLSQSGILPFYRFWPHRLQGAGFFLAVLRKEGSAQKPYIRTSNVKRKLTSSRSPFIPAQYLARDTEYQVITQGDLIYAITHEFRDDLELLSRKLRVKRPGLFLGRIQGRVFRPSTELAWSQALPADTPAVTLDRPQALKYLSHTSLELDAGSMTGRVLVRSGGLNLGWAKISNEGRFKNQYPIPWRLRKPPPF